MIREITHGFSDTSSPVRLVEVILATGLRLIDSSDDPSGSMEEWAATVVDRVAQQLANHLSECVRVGQPCRFEFTLEDSFEHVQGSCFPRPTDSLEMRKAKESRGTMSGHRVFLQQMDDRRFEAVCSGILEILGCENPTLTQKSADQGIDFFGQLRLEGRLGQRFTMPGPDRRFSAWLVGQAKRYRGTASTPDLRELVGSVELAKARAFADDGSALPSLNMRVCDPVFYLFMTTGRLSSQIQRLVEASGIIALDGDSIAALLADSDIGIVDGTFDSDSMNHWIDGHLDPPLDARTAPQRSEEVTAAAAPAQPAP